MTQYHMDHMFSLIAKEFNLKDGKSRARLDLINSMHAVRINSKREIEIKALILFHVILF